MGARPLALASRPSSDAVRVAVWLLVGLLLSFHTQILSGFALIQVDLGDIRFLQYLFEHEWRWLQGDALHPGLWQAPFFFPAQTVGAYGDTVLSLLPLYVPWRLLGFAPDSALQATALGIFACNFLAMYRLLRVTLKLSVGASIAGAFAFSFASLRVARIGHLQLCGQFYSVLAIDALLRFFADDSSDLKRRRAIYWFFGCLLAQLYAGFYVTWMLAFALLIAACLSALHAPTRRKVAGLVAEVWPHCLLAGLLALLLAWPWLNTYASVADTVGLRSFAEIEGMLPRLESFLFSGRENWLLGQLEFTRALAQSLPMAHEHRLFPGVVLLLCGGFGCWLARRKALLVLSLLSVVLMLLLALQLPIIKASAWSWVIAWVPGAGALRAVARLQLMALFPLALGLAYCAAWLETRRLGLLLAGLALMFCVEQLTISPRYDKQQARAVVRSISAAIDKRCAAFYLRSSTARPAYAVQLDAMLAGLERGVPTLNGYSGNTPPGWDLSEPQLTTRAQLEQWLARFPNSPGGAQLCVVELVLDPRGQISAQARK